MEVEAILTRFEDWGQVDRSHRKLAHRGSYTGKVWVSPESVRRVLTLADKHFRPLHRPDRSHKRPFPDWATYTPNSIWIYDTTHFTRAGMAVLIVEVLVSRKWITEVVSSEETSTRSRSPSPQRWRPKACLRASTHAWPMTASTSAPTARRFAGSCSRSRITARR